jgi:hypothetical protein
VKERVRTGRHGALLDDVGRDVRYAFRLFARQPTFAVVIVGTLALGIGANTAIFSIVDSLLLRTLPIEEPERLARIVDAPPSSQQSWTYAIWEEIQRHADRFDGVFAWTRFDAQFNLTQGGETQYANGVWASAASFDVLGIKPARGRLFLPSDDVRGGGREGPVVVISDAFWQKHFGAAPDAIGRTSASFGALALLMAAVGLYGVTSYAVTLRRAEIGIRMALGATRGSVIRLVLTHVTLLIGAGIIVGLALGAWASRFVGTLLYGLEPGDPATLAASAVTLALIGTVAGWLPANRASRLDPTQILRDS